MNNMICEGTRFCKNLDAETRGKLCENCVRMVLPEGAKISSTDTRFLLLISGLGMTEIAEKNVSFVTPGDFIPPRISPKLSSDAVLSGKDNHNLDGGRWALRFPFPSTVASFDEEFVYELFKEPGFARAAYRSLLEFNQRATLFDAHVHCSSAYDAVKYAVLYCRALGENSPTHAQLAMLTGRQRPTVTKALASIQRKEPSVFAQSFQSR